MPARSTTSNDAYVVFTGLKRALNRSTRSPGTRATPVCISPRAVPNNDVATCCPVSRLKSEVLPLLASPTRPIFMRGSCYHTGSARPRRPAATSLPRAHPSLSHYRPLDGKGTAITLLLSALWGANPVAAKIGLDYVPPLRLAWMRLALGGLAVLIYAWSVRHPHVFSVQRGEWRVLWSVGLLFAFQIALVNIGLARTTSIHASLLINSYAIHTVVLAHFFIPGDRLTAAKLGGILVAYAGIVILFVPDFSFGSATLVGDLLVSASAVVLGERTVYLARAVQTLDPVKLLVYQSAIGGACLWLLSLWWEAGVPTIYSLPLAASLF